MTTKTQTQKTELDINFLNNLNELITQHSEWAANKFPESTAISSLKGDIRESNECIDAIKELNLVVEHNGEPRIFEIHRNAVGYEYADKLLYYLDSIRRFGFTLEDILGYALMKMEINKNRKWNINNDNSYSHIKPENTEPQINPQPSTNG